METKPNAEGRKYRNVNGVARPMRDQKIGKPQRTPFVYDAVDLAMGLDALPNWLPRILGDLVADRIRDSREWRGGEETEPARSAPPPAPAPAAPPASPPAPAQANLPGVRADEIPF